MNSDNVQPGLIEIKLAPCLALNADEERAVHFISTYPLNAIRERVLKDGALDEAIVDKAILEYRKFMILARLTETFGLSESLTMLSEEVDEIWHTHVIFTRSYANFCDGGFGAFVHHEPLSGGSTMDEGLVARFAFLATYQRVFGDLSPLWKTDWSMPGIRSFVEEMARNEACRDAFRASFPRFADVLLETRPET